MVAAGRHPEHDRLHQEVRSWYRTPVLGYRVELGRFGSYRRHIEDPDANLIIVDAVAPLEAPEFLADAGSCFENRTVNIWVDDRELDAALGPALVAAGASIDKANVHLAHVGSRSEPIRPPGIMIEQVTADTLLDYTLVKLKGFANSEDAPAVEHVDQELAMRGRELASIGRFLIARVGDEPAAILGYYEGGDRLIFNLATRMPFRRRGLARNLLSQVVADSYDKNCRSVIINTDPADIPIQWYRRLGFTDEVYWRRNYLFAPAKIVR